MLFFFLYLATCDKYAILFAGSNGWDNYRHQADVFYMYKLLLDHGFDESHISMWAYNDIVNHELNPYKGKMFHTLDNEDIYPGEDKINYKGEDVNGIKFIRYLKELKTTANDDIFIYYNDHGSPNYLSCPVGYPMSTYQVSNTLRMMERHCQYRNILFIVEACFSGTLGDVLKSKNVTLLTASTNSQSSYSLIYHRYASNFMSNEFSAYLMSEIEMNPQATVNEIYQNVKAKMGSSQPQIYGDNFEMPISYYIGVSKTNKVRRQALDSSSMKKVETLSTKKAKDLLKEHNEKTKMLRKKLQKTIREIVRNVAGGKSEYYMTKDETRDLQKCHEPVADTFFKLFGEFNPDDGGLLMPLKALCGDYDKDVIIKAIHSVLSL